MSENILKELPAKLGISKLVNNKTYFYEVNKDQDWVREILNELNENAEPGNIELENTDLRISLELTKKYKSFEGEFFLVKGRAEANYITRCVKSLEEILFSFEVDLKACFVDGALEKDDAYHEQLETFQENEMFELYFYDKKQIDIHSMVNEQIFLNVEQYPIKDSNVENPWLSLQTDTKQ